MYKIKLADDRYAAFEQFADEQIEVCSVSFEQGDSFNTKSEAIKYANAINNKKDGNYIIYGNKVAISVVEYKTEILNEIDL